MKKAYYLFISISLTLSFLIPASSSFADNIKTDKVKYDIAAYYWPSCHDEPRWRPFFQGDTQGEWKSIRNSKPKFEGHWQPRVPLWGYEMEDDPKVMEKKINAAVTHGVNVFIFDWYWFENQPFLEEAINDGFLKAENVNKIKFYLMWANHDASTAWNIEKSHNKETIWPGAVDLKTFETVVERVIRMYMKHPSYYKIDGKPVFSIYDLHNLLKGLGGLKKAQKALVYFREQVKKAGFPGLHIQTTLRRKYFIKASGVDSAIVVNNNTIKKLNLDSLTHYTFTHSTAPLPDYIQWADKAIKDWTKMSKQFNIPYFPQVSIGWDNNARFKEFKKCVYENVNPQVFKKYLLKAKEYADTHTDQQKLILINSWNEWVEGSYLEPDKRFGFGYLEAVRDVF